MTDTPTSPQGLRSLSAAASSPAPADATSPNGLRPFSAAASSPAPAALIVGGGLSGMQSALLLAETGHRVYLLDAAAGIGGSLHLLDRTFPTDSCGLCIASPTNATYCPSLECSLHPNIVPMSLTELLSLDGEPGAFRATVRHNPRYVNISACNLCGDCAKVCPADRPYPYTGDPAPHKAIDAPPARAVPNAYAIDMSACIRCGKCVDACPTGAINLDEQPTEETLDVGAVILSPGYAPFDAAKKGEFGFGVLSNVVTSLEFERMTSEPGATKSYLVKPSDGQPPRRIAFIQCVGSRDETIHREYCSSVCCMYTAKQARAAVEIQPGVQVTVFTMDIRTFGKDYDEYWDRTEAAPGVEFRRAMVSSIRQHPQTQELTLTYTAGNGLPAEDAFDLVVLSVGFDAPESAAELARSLGLEVNEYGFAQSGEWNPVGSARPGIIAAGCYQEPKDIPDTMAEADAAAAEAMPFLSPLPSAAPPQPIAERVSKDDEPKVGVYLCDCAGTLNALDISALSDYAAALPHVAAVKVVGDACTGDGPVQLAAWISDSGINRLAFAGCSPRLMQTAVETAAEQAGLDAALIDYANIREGCAYVHADSPAAAQAKARDLIAMAVTRAAHLQPVRADLSDVSRGALVIGGGLAGMTAALTLGDMGHEVTLIERSDKLGGHLFNVGHTAETPDPSAQAEALIERITRHPLVSVYTDATVQSLSGVGGNFISTIQRTEGDPLGLRHGAVILATGGEEAKVAEYLYGQDPRVMLQGDLSRSLASSSLRAERSNLAPELDAPLQSANTIVMIQCAGSRDDNRPYCSRICCTQAVHNAIALKQARPDTDVFVLYRDIRTFGFRELLYRQARDLGVVFIRYEKQNKPLVRAAANGLTVTVSEPVLRQPVEIAADLVVLSTGIVPTANADLARTLDVPLDANGFFEEQHPKMRPLNMMKPGVFLAGLAHAPHFISETIAQAEGAAMRAAAYLAQQPRPSKRTRVRVNKRLCSFCGLCVSACPYGARVLDYEERVAQVLPELCQGCGICAVVCPNKATQQETFEHDSLLAEVDTAVLGL